VSCAGGWLSETVSALPANRGRLRSVTLARIEKVVKPPRGSIRKHETVQNQPVEAFKTARSKHPAQVRQACTANQYPPPVPGKPGEFTTGGAQRGAVSHRLKTSDLKDDAVGVGKGVPVGALHGDPLFRFGNPLAAMPAQDLPLFLLLGLFRGRRPGRFLGWAAFARFPESQGNEEKPGRIVPMFSRRRLARGARCRGQLRKRHGPVSTVSRPHVFLRAWSATAAWADFTAAGSPRYSRRIGFNASSNS